MPDWRARLCERLAAEGVVPAAHAEAIDEIADHLNDLHRAALRSGQPPDEAAAAVEVELVRMGPLAIAVAERGKNKRRDHPQVEDWRTGLVADARHAVRALRHDRGFSGIVILTLALGIGACTAVFSIVNALLLGPLPFPEPERLVLVWETDKDNRSETFIVAKPVYEDWNSETRSFASLGIYEFQTFNLQNSSNPQNPCTCRARRT